MVKQILWSDDFNVLLLECILQAGAHIPIHKKTKETWDKVQDLFFLSDKAKHLKDDCYTNGNSEKFRERFKNIKIMVYATEVWKEWKGKNKSAIEDDEPNKLFKLLRQIEFDVEDEELNGKSAQKEDKKRRLESIEAAVTTNPTEEPKKRMKVEKGIIKDPISGIITENCSRKIKLSAFDEAVIRIAEGNTKKKEESYEESTLNVMLGWIDDQSESWVQDICEHLNCKDADEVAQYIELYETTCLLQLYCSCEFQFDKFNSYLKELGCKLLIGVKIFKIFEYVRKVKIVKNEKEIMTPSSNSSSSATLSSSSLQR